MLYGKTGDFSAETISHNRKREFHAEEKFNEQIAPPILHRIAARDGFAVEECLNRHGNLVWAVAKQFTDSTEEAEIAAQEIFRDLWKCAVRFDAKKCAEKDFVILVARRWLIKRNLHRFFNADY